MATAKNENFIGFQLENCYFTWAMATAKNEVFIGFQLENCYLVGVNNIWCGQKKSWWRLSTCGGSPGSEGTRAG